MKQEKQRTEISAYLDGEAHSDDVVRARLEADAEAAAYFDKMKEVSTSLRSIPEIAPRHGFAARVCACIEAAHLETIKTWRLPLGAHVALAMTLIVGVLAFGMTTSNTPVSTTAPVVAVSLLEEEQALVAKLEEQLGADALKNEPSAVGLYVSRRPSEVYNERLLNLVASVDYMEAFPAAWGSDPSTLVTTLDDAGRQALKELLSSTIERESSNDEG